MNDFNLARSIWAALRCEKMREQQGLTTAGLNSLAVSLFMLMNSVSSTGQK